MNDSNKKDKSCTVKFFYPELHDFNFNTIQNFEDLIKANASKKTKNLPSNFQRVSTRTRIEFYPFSL